MTLTQKELDAIQKRADKADEASWGYYYGPASAGSAHLDNKTLLKLVKELKGALERIKEMEGMTLLGTDGQEPGGYYPGGNPSAERAHELGAAKAFDQASMAAKTALSRLNGEGD